MNSDYLGHEMNTFGSKRSSYDDRFGHTRNKGFNGTKRKFKPDLDWGKRYRIYLCRE